MKKATKITLLVIASLTVITAIAAIVMLNAVSGDTLFYMDSTLGYVCAVSYRWVCLASVILILFWVLLAVKNRKTVSAMLTKLKGKFEKTAKPTGAPTVTTAPDAVTPTAAISADKMFCTKCGKQMSAKSKFCPFCGELVIVADETTKTPEAT